MAHGFLWLHALTPLHNGAGQGLGSIDRPVIREACTGYPFVQSSTLKGAVRAQAVDVLADGTDGNGAGTRDAAEADDVLLAAFGKGETEDGNQGCLVFADAQLLLLPARSLVGTFAWVTSRLALARLARWAKIAGSSRPDSSLISRLLASLPKLNAGTAIGSDAGDSPIRLEDRGAYCIEGLILQPAEGMEAASKSLLPVAEQLGDLLFCDDDAKYWQTCLKNRLVLLADDDFDHLMRHGMQVEANIKIKPSGVTQNGSLRYTEYLPAESVLVSLVTILSPLRHKRQQGGKGAPVGKAEVIKLAERALGRSASFQLGADESKGRGIVNATLSFQEGGAGR